MPWVPPGRGPGAHPRRPRYGAAVIESFLVPARFCGPPASGNGGWTSGHLAQLVDPDATVTVRLRTPPPLDVEMDVARADDGTVEIWDGQTLVASAISAEPLDEPELPAPVPYADAEAAGASYEGLVCHPFPTCFACGTDRDPADALCLRTGPLPGRTRCGPRPGRRPSPPRRWCGPRWTAPAAWASGIAGREMVLGTMTARVHALPAVGEPHVVLAWPRGTSGRKFLSADLPVRRQPAACSGRPRRSGWRSTRHPSGRCDAGHSGRGMRLWSSTVQPPMTTHPDTQNDLQDLEAQFRTELGSRPRPRTCCSARPAPPTPSPTSRCPRSRCAPSTTSPSGPPPSMNNQPLRIVLVRCPEAREPPRRDMAEGNKAKTVHRPAGRRPRRRPRLPRGAPADFPHFPGARTVAADDAMRAESATLNGTLQVAYFILAVRAAGLAAGPMTGFDAEALNREFFPDGEHRVLAVVNIGKPGESAWMDRLPRLDYDEVVTTV